MKDCVFIFSLFFSWISLFSQGNDFIAAYDSMHAKMVYEYPMGEWKGIHWDQLDSLIRPKIKAASLTGDSVGFYTALQAYMTQIHDGHVNIRRGWLKIRDTAMFRDIGGSYGFATTLLDDGRLVATLVNPGSSAAVAGMTFGATILEINDQPATSVLNTVGVLWAELIPATRESTLMNQCRFIGRAPVGASMKIMFQNREEFAPVTSTLTAVDDQYATYHQTSMWVYASGPTVTSEILQPEGYGYIRLTGESAGDDSAVTRKIYTDFRDALLAIRESGSRGLILDMRINYGGMDALSAALAGFFYLDTALYENLTWYNPETRSLEIIPLPIATLDPVTLKPRYNPAYPNGAQYIEPQTFSFNNPVIVLVSPRAVSSGEGLPMALQKLPQCQVLGFHGTNGSFGLVGTFYNIIPPPDSLNVRFPYGCSTNREMVIQLDSDSTMTGGVIPDIRVPINDTVIDQLHKDSLDVELLYAIHTLNAMLGTAEQTGLQPEIFLEQNTPNPFHETTTITYSLSQASLVTLEILDLYGRTNITLIDGSQPAGRYTLHVDAGNLTPGMYLIRLRAASLEQVKPCIVI